MKEYIKQVIGRFAKDIREFGLAGVLVIVYLIVFSRLFGTICPVRLVTGVPCPGCGITRAALLFLTGRWQQAWQMNLVIFPIVLTVLYYGVNRYFLNRKVKGMRWIILGIAVMLLAVYLQHMIRYFPGREPYSYLDGNLLERILPIYRKILRGVVESAK